MAHTVVVQQPYAKSNSQMGPWNSGICDCCQDMETCCYGFWCCPCFACSTTGEFGESTCLPLIDLCGPGLMAAFGMAICVPPVTLGMRVAVRHRYEIGGSLCEDLLVSCFCTMCSWCQMNREIKQRKKFVTTVIPRPMANIQQQPIIITR